LTILGEVGRCFRLRLRPSTAAEVILTGQNVSIEGIRRLSFDSSNSCKATWVRNNSECILAELHACVPGEVIVLQYNGKLMIKIAGRTYKSLVSGPGALSIEGYEVEPLFKGYQATRAFSADVPSDNWFLAIPQLSVEGPRSVPSGGSPWDVAHRVAGAAGYSFYVEPDFIRTLRSPFTQPPTKGLNPVWAPPGPVNPGWHLYDSFTGFLSTGLSGSGIRIAHLDTGYSGTHQSRPLNLHPELGWNFYEGNSCTIDPGTNFGWPPPTPGHGTATLALLAGNKLDMTFGGYRFNNYFGGAPEAEIVPVRIGASVIHFEDSAMAQGIDYALPPRCNPENRCDVITLSPGGFPALSWAQAVNNVYDDGIVLAAAAGDYEILFVEIPGHDAIWPSRFRRAINATGATYDKKPYVTDDWLELQGSWGPDDIMDKAVASYAPNTAWMEFDTTVDGWRRHLCLYTSNSSRMCAMASAK
jgi:hypothetical protein